MPEEVTILENKIHRIHKMLNEENVYKEDPIRAKKAEQELQVMENSLETLFEEWESLETKKSMFLKTNEKVLRKNVYKYRSIACNLNASIASKAILFPL